MVEYILYLFSCLALAYGWSDTEASRPIRNFIARIPYIRKPLLCHECSSFWIALALSIFLNPFDGILPQILSNIISGFNGFFINYIFVKKILKY